MFNMKISPEKTQQRLLLLKEHLKSFNEEYKLKMDEASIDSACTLINDVYWNEVVPLIHKNMADREANIDIHKIIAGTQLAIMATLAVRDENTLHLRIDPRKKAHRKHHPELCFLNAKFAIFVSVSLLEKWSNVNLTPVKNLSNFWREHITWLSNVGIENGIETFPVFCCAQLWYFIEEYCKLWSSREKEL